MVSQAAQDGTGQQLRRGKMADSWHQLHNVMVSACYVFGDTVSHLPNCYSSYALVPDADGSYFNCSYLSGRPFPIPTFRPLLRPAKLVTWQPVIPNRS